MKRCKLGILGSSIEKTDPPMEKVNCSERVTVLSEKEMISQDEVIITLMKGNPLNGEKIWIKDGRVKALSKLEGVRMIK